MVDAYLFTFLLKRPPVIGILLTLSISKSKLQAGSTWPVVKCFVMIGVIFKEFLQEINNHHVSRLINDMKYFKYLLTMWLHTESNV